VNPILTKSYRAGAAISPCRLLKFGSSDNLLIQATDSSAPFVGASAEYIDVLSGAQVDAHRLGLAYVRCGGNVTRGAYVTADANGRAVQANIVPGAAIHVAGRAETDGVLDDVIAVMIDPTVIANDAGITSVDVTISSAELLALNATPRPLVAAPGAGLALVLVDAQYFLDYNSVAYAGIAAGEDLAIKYTDGAGAIVTQVETTGFLDQTVDSFRHVYPLADAAKTPVANAPLVAHMLTGEIITGNSPLKVRVRYRTITLAF
jgi:hypothetical protein